MKIKRFIILVTFIIIVALYGYNNFSTNSFDFEKKVTSTAKNYNKNKSIVNNSNKVSDLINEKEISENSTNKPIEYEIINKTYAKNSVKINYPQLENFTDSTKLNLINKNLEETALSILDSYLKYDSTLNELTMDVNYEIKLKNNTYVSIVYTGYSNLKGAAYPLSVFYTTNIDIGKGSIIRLSDYADITDIVNKFKILNNVTVLSDNKEIAEMQKITLSNIDDTQLLSILENADFYKVNDKVKHPKEETYSYMDNDNIVISLNVIHALGDHAEFAVKK